MKNKDLYKQIRIICAANGWEVYRTFTDKRKDNQRVKFMRNGYRVTPGVQAKILADVQKVLPKGVDARWEVRYHTMFNSEYDALIVRIPHKE